MQSSVFLPDSVLIPSKYDSEVLNGSIESGGRKLCCILTYIIVDCIASENFIEKNDPNDTIIL